MAYSNYGYGGAAFGFNCPTETTAGSYNPRYHYQAAQNAGFELNANDGLPRTVYVGNLDSSVTEEFIATLFGQIGMVTKTKVIADPTSDPYAFVEFADHYTATQALQAMNKRLLLDKEMKVNWATKPGTLQKTDTTKHFHVFVGDLSPEIDNKVLKEAFDPFGEVSDAKVIRDPQTLKSKGYGFVSYPKREEAERAIEQMNGQWLGRRTIRTNWASRKPTGLEGYQAKPTVDEIYGLTGPENTSVYVGNLSPNATEDDVRQNFSKFGTILDIRHFKAQGYSFVRFSSKDAAAKAIVEMNGAEVNGQSLKCSWGKAEVTATGRPDLSAHVSHFNNPSGPTFSNGANGSTAAGNSGANANLQQQYWNYYQQYYNNPQFQEQWQAYWQQLQAQPQSVQYQQNQSRQAR